MDKEEFKALVQKYKNEIMKMAGITVNAQKMVEPDKEPILPINQSQISQGTQESVNGSLVEESEQNTVPATKQQNAVNSEIDSGSNGDAKDNPTPMFGAGAPYTGKASGENAIVETYQEFLDRDKEYGLLKIQAFTARQALPISGVKVTVSKKFSDMDKVFFEGETDSSGIIDNIKLPTTAKSLSESPEDVLPYSIYDFKSSHPQYQTENADQIQIFPNIKSIQPVTVIIS